MVKMTELEYEHHLRSLTNKRIQKINVSSPVEAHNYFQIQFLQI